MKKNHPIELLKKHTVQAQKAAGWLKKSIQKCHLMELDKKLTEPQFDALENLTSRFALDVLNRAAKRGFLDDETLRKIREIRNAIAHEYTEEELVNIFKEVKRLSPLLLDVQAKLETYTRRYL